jgi:hypothetical protein
LVLGIDSCVLEGCRSKLSKVECRFVRDNLIIIDIVLKDCSWKLSRDVRIRRHVFQEALKIRIIFGDLVCPFIRLLPSIKESELATLFVTFPNVVDTLNHAVWHW